MLDRIAKYFRDYRAHRRYRALLGHTTDIAALLRSMKSAERKIVDLEEHVAKLENGVEHSSAHPDPTALTTTERKAVRDAVRELERDHKRLLKQVERHVAKAEDWRRKAASAKKAGRPDLEDEAHNRGADNLAAAKEFQQQEQELRNIIARLRTSRASILE